MAEQYDNLQGSEQDAKTHADTNLVHPEPGPGSADDAMGSIVNDLKLEQNRMIYDEKQSGKHFRNNIGTVPSESKARWDNMKKDSKGNWR